jgi:C4-dicarboxylate-specific signal transduction histidine kinase
LCNAFRLYHRRRRVLVGAAEFIDPEEQEQTTALEEKIAELSAIRQADKQTIADREARIEKLESDQDEDVALITKLAGLVRTRNSRISQLDKLIGTLVQEVQSKNKRP